VALLFQFGAKFDVVEDLAVVGEQQRAVGQGLAAALDVDDAEACVADGGGAAHRYAPSVGAAVAQGAEHGLERAGLSRLAAWLAQSANPALSLGPRSRGQAWARDNPVAWRGERRTL